MKSTVSSTKANLVQNGLSYKKLNLTDFEKGQLSYLFRRSRWNHAVFIGKSHLRLPDTYSAMRTAARKGCLLIVGNDYFLRA